MTDVAACIYKYIKLIEIDEFPTSTKLLKQ